MLVEDIHPPILKHVIHLLTVSRPKNSDVQSQDIHNNSTISTKPC